MYSARSKVLHRILGVPLVSYPVERALELKAERVVAVLGHQLAEVEKALNERHGPGTVTVVEQAEQKGTGHAVRLGMAPLRGWKGIVVILYGDVPLLTRETLAALVKKARAKGSLVMLTSEVANPHGYGRVVRDQRGHIVRVVEHKDASPEELEIREVNAGIYAGPADFLRQAVAHLSPRNAQGELYLTDIIEKAAASIGVDSVDVSSEETSGVNDRAQLIEAETIMGLRVISRWMKHTTFRDPATVLIEADVTIGQDAEIEGNVTLRGQTRIGKGATISQGCVLADTVVGDGAVLLPYTVATQAVIGPGVEVGPFAHLRPGTELGPDGHGGVATGAASKRHSGRR